MKKEDISERTRKWYQSYNEPPPWSSVVGFMVREIEKAKKAQREEIIEIMKGMKKKIEGFESEASNVGYNQALEDLITKLKDNK